MVLLVKSSFRSGWNGNENEIFVYVGMNHTVGYFHFFLFKFMLFKCWKRYIIINFYFIILKFILLIYVYNTVQYTYVYTDRKDEKRTMNVNG